MRKLLLFMLVVLMTACSQVQEPEPVSEQQSGKSEYEVSISEALKNADAFFAAIEDGKTRSEVRLVESVETILGDVTRGEEATPMYYIVNYKDNKGFALLSADSRLLPVYAISDSGHMSLADTENNPGLKSFIEALPTSSDLSKTRASGGGVVIGPAGDYKVGVSPMISAPVRKWDQLSYNALVRSKNKLSPNNPNTPVGCTVVATGVIMSYFKSPKSITTLQKEKYTFDWDAINRDLNSGRSSIERLFEVLGRTGGYLSCTYTTGNTSTTFAHYWDKTYKKFGYDKAQLKYNIGFDKNIAINELCSARPLQITGNNGQEGSGHCWVIDGYAWYSINPSFVPPAYYFHFVWGNGDTCNGYYAHMAANTGNDQDDYFKDKPHYYDNLDPGGKVGSYYKELTMYYNFIPILSNPVVTANSIN